MNINKRLARALVACAGAVILTVTMAAPAQAAPGGTPLDQCVSAAGHARYQQWLCVGGNLHVQKDEHGKPADRDVQVAVDQPATASGVLHIARASFTRVVPAAGGDFYDTWCEYGSICSRRISAYASETKGNAAYGNQNGALGSFDVILTTNLNGRQAQWTVRTIWDSGPALTFNAPTVHCRQAGFWAAVDCGNHGYNNFTIQPYGRYTSNRLYGNKLVSAGDYYGLFNTQFVPYGYGAYNLATLRTSTFTCPSGTGNCTFP